MTSSKYLSYNKDMNRLEQRNLEILELYKRGVTQRAIAQMYGVSQQRISQIVQSTPETGCPNIPAFFKRVRDSLLRRTIYILLHKSGIKEDNIITKGY